MWSRGRAQQSRVAALLRFEASVQAQYGAYKYHPPPTMRGTFDVSEIAIVLGRGQRVMGYSVVDDPPGYLGWIVPVVAERCFTRVTDIAIYDERFSDADVDLLLAFPGLRALDVSDAAITDDGLKGLATLKQLVMLNVSGTQVSASSLRHLAKCKELKELDISETDADDAIVEYLKRELPACWIRW